MRPVGSTFLSLQLVTQSAIKQNQSALARAQVELSTQRHNDVLQELSGHTGRNIRWHSELNTIESSIHANDLSNTRAQISQTSLSTSIRIASDFLNNLISARGAEGGREIVQAQAKNALAMFSDALNVQIDGNFLFAGRNQDTPPIKTYYGGPGEAQFDISFLAAFGITKTDPAVQNISPTQIDSFLNGSFGAMFSSPNWETLVSNAGDENVKAFVGQGQNVDILANANEAPIRQLYSAIVAVAEIGSGDINDASYKKLIDAAASKVSSAVQGLADMQSRIGIGQKTLQDATGQLKAQKTWLNEVILKTESVDTYEVATRINGLMTQLEASYSVTSRISRISLLNYL
jgi:flagellar hook-associated protein 3 FlgL